MAIGKITAAVTAWMCVAAAPVSAPYAPAGPTLSVTPAGAIMDAPFDVTLTGVRPGTPVVIRTIRRTEEGAPWTAIAHYTADAAGTVDAARSASVSGTYTGVSAHGLLCSALPVEPDKLGAYIAGFAKDPRQPTSFPDPLGRTSIEVTALIDDKVVASATAWRSHAEGAAGEDVAVAEGWKGVFFPPAAGVKVGAPVLVVPGSGGGLFRYTAARFASHGHPTLAMAMYRYPGLPDSLVNYPVERVHDAATWLAKRAGTRQAVVMGISRGSEAAALAAVHYPQAFSGVVLSVPSHFADAGALGPAAKPGLSAWTVRGKPTLVTDLGFNPDDPRILQQAKTLPGYNASAMVRDMWGSAAFEAKYGIPFERIEAPVLVLGAGEDATWPSGISAERIKRRLVRHGKGKLADVRVYPGAGHSMVTVGSGALSTSGYNAQLKGFVAFGGTPNGTCEASFDSVRDTLAFLNRLQPAGRHPRR